MVVSTPLANILVSWNCHPKLSVGTKRKHTATIFLGSSDQFSNKWFMDVGGLFKAGGLNFNMSVVAPRTNRDKNAG